MFDFCLKLCFFIFLGGIFLASLTRSNIKACPKQTNVNLETVQSQTICCGHCAHAGFNVYSRFAVQRCDHHQSLAPATASPATSD